MLASAAQLDELYYRSGAARWALSRDKFLAAMERSAEKSFANRSRAPRELDAYLKGLHLEDLALATACLEDCEPAWEYFVSNFRGYLRSAAAAVLHCSSAAPEAAELADSLFAELYGLSEAPGRPRSLFRYFHGRSTLKTWLRAVLAQRHIDAIRVNRRFESLDADSESGPIPELPSVAPPPSDPRREHYATLFTRALQTALAALDPRDHQRFRCYYAEEKTLAEIGRQLGEHESSVSRNLDRVRAALRRNIEETLRNGCPAANGFAAERGLSEAQISLCFEYAAADVPFDLEKVLPPPRGSGPSPGRPKP
jgi:RNA polymerase sigma factor (sigma-70 family)